jgi:hypothetical protein
MAERFWPKVQKAGPDDCWIWIGALDRHGYGTIGQINQKGIWRMARAHRIAYELEIGPIPDGLTIDHLCRVPACVNPSHMEPVTKSENTRRGFAAKTQCPQGHPYTEDNIYWDMTRGQYRTRKCRTCVKTRVNARYHRNKAKQQD